VTLVTIPLTRARPLSRGMRVLELLLAALFVGSGAAKLLAVPSMVSLFAEIGVGQWFRLVIGVVELAGGDRLPGRPRPARRPLAGDERDLFAGLAQLVQATHPAEPGPAAAQPAPVPVGQPGLAEHPAGGQAGGAQHDLQGGVQVGRLTDLQGGGLEQVSLVLAGPQRVEREALPAEPDALQAEADQQADAEQRGAAGGQPPVAGPTAYLQTASAHSSPGSACLPHPYRAGGRTG
jgi:hypothetical protein